MSTNGSDAGLGWVGHDPASADVVAMRHHLEAHNGIRGLELVDADDIARAVRIFRRDGFVVVLDVLDAEQLAFLREGSDREVREIIALDPERRGNRGSHRYSFGASSRTRSLLHLPEWRMLIDLPRLTPVLAAIFGSADYSVRAAGGDFCLPGAVEYQPLHSDMRDWVDPGITPYSAFHDQRGLLSIRELPTPYVCVNFLTVDFTRLNGPTRQIPGSQHSREPFPTLDEEPEWMRLSTVCPAPAGAAMIRDVRAWHGGTPNLSEEIRAMPNAEFYAPWFREPTLPSIERRHFDELSDHGKHLARYIVLDSSEQLDTGYRIGPTPSVARQVPDD